MISLIGFCYVAAGHHSQVMVQHTNHVHQLSPVLLCHCHQAQGVLGLLVILVTQVLQLVRPLLLHCAMYNSLHMGVLCPTGKVHTLCLVIR